MPEVSHLLLQPRLKSLKRCISSSSQLLCACCLDSSRRWPRRTSGCAAYKPLDFGTRRFATLSDEKTLVNTLSGYGASVVTCTVPLLTFAAQFQTDCTSSYSPDSSVRPVRWLFLRQFQQLHMATPMHYQLHWKCDFDREC